VSVEKLILGELAKNSSRQGKRSKFLSITRKSGRAWLVIDGSYSASSQILTL